ncbi:hypothetical protein PoB_005862000 [Plakobranchus ocellatus]|uniref:Uncharacterized protein n=1 Tax=Plakobranchus ocellatus TaxID=259542 RepID=A0AAV4CKH6_9GAST|nr:hypothetical protein PoB_005862000 [Plakobranchus ocellatus]
MRLGLQLELPLSLIDTVALMFEWGVGGTVASESALRSAGTLLSRVRAPLPALWPDGGLKSLRSPCCGLAIYKKTKTKPNQPIAFQQRGDLKLPGLRQVRRLVTRSNANLGHQKGPCRSQGGAGWLATMPPRRVLLD